ncbi:TPA: hypothetical protein O1I26_002645 [Staphylococcus aureus]|nr:MULTISPECIES: hypothetical protein [Staphylococcaceae]MCD5142609.1 hypothetical protein [Mammaliicoccus sciuri]WAA03261.1 hypothetical protein M1F50_13795 [Staphylococcus aureus]HCY2893779.1 hypothetical protein [Staphylococcus aureus]HCY2926065.1 hypothetical protein [Staphylococcus aureus]HDF4307640.1 hypothetical protein [Staphylococcus aureus]
MYENYMNFIKKNTKYKQLSDKSEIVYVITFESDPQEDLDNPEVVAVFKEFDSVEHYLKENDVVDLGYLLTSDKDTQNKNTSYMRDVYEISVFDVSTGKKIY